MVLRGFVRCLIEGMRAEATFPLEVKTRRPDAFYLGLTVAGYLSLALALWCFGRGIVPPAYCAVGLLEHPYAQDPEVLLFLVPGVVFGLAGILQLQLDRTCSSKVNHMLLGLSFRCNALAVAGMCGATALSGVQDSWPEAVRLVLGLASLGLFVVGLALTITNIAWSLMRRAKHSP